MKTPDELHYYLDAKYLEVTLASRRVRAYNVYSMDDLTEMGYAYELVKVKLQERVDNQKLMNQGATSARLMIAWFKSRFAPTGRDAPSQVFVRSFAAVPDDAALWHMYTANKGVCLSFPTSQLECVARSADLRLVPVIYDPDEQTAVIDRLFGRLMGIAIGTPGLSNLEELHFRLFDKHIDEAVLALVALKSKRWDSQREWRLVSKRLDPASPIIQIGEKYGEPATYIEVDLGTDPACAAVIAGPHMPDYDAVEKLAESHGIPITQSEVKIRTGSL